MLLRTLAAFMLLTPLAAHAQDAPLTPFAAVEAHAELKSVYEIPDFRIGGTYDLDDPESFAFGAPDGTTLESLGADPLRVAYIDVGTPVRNEAGEIINAVVVNSYYSGDSTNYYEFWFEGQGGNEFSQGPLIGPGRWLDTDKYYVVMLDALGLWGTSKPSDGLGTAFPQYSYFDMVQANYRLLRDHLNVSRAALVTGVSMGATQTFVWGVMHPEFMHALAPIGGTTQSDGDDPVGRWTFQLMTSAIESDPVWQETAGDYYDRPKAEHPNRGVEFGWSVLALTGFDFDFRTTQPWDAVKGDVFAWDQPDAEQGAALASRAEVFDAVDLIYRNEAGNRHNINEELHRITARTLVMHVENDQWLIYRLAEQAADRIPGADLLGIESPLAHYAVFSMPNQVAADPVFSTFMADVQSMIPAPRYVASTYRTPGVATEIDPEASFWKDHVTYPFPVQFATATDDLGREWEIGYMDVYEGSAENPETLVVIHGKGAFGGHYGNVMKAAVEAGLRVVVPDLPHYGMSGPGNLGKNPARSMANMREAIHDLVVEQLGIEQAYYMGHSLGGHHVLGYTLRWPEAVKGLVLEAPAGLESYPMEQPMPDGTMAPLFDPALANDFEAWQKLWGPTGILESEIARTPQEIEDFYYWRTTDPATGAVTPAATGYFLRDSAYARLHTDQRVGLTKGNPAELEQWATAFIFDIHAMVSELLEDDPDSLYARLDQIEAPIFLAFGAKEPFIPGGPLNGKFDLAADIVTPFMGRMAAAGNTPTLKIYPDAGHFIHTDAPVEFPRDVVSFVTTGLVDTFSPQMADQLINGVTAAPAEAVPAATSGDAGGLNK